MKQTYEYDNASGNLLSRDYRPSGSATGLTESFSYDNLDRLTGSQVTGAGLMSVTYSPDGNINTKTDAGSYTYDPSKQNAVTSITGNNGTISLADQVITYNGNNLATRIEEDNSSYAIYYNPLKQRIKTVCTPVGGPAITRYYSGSYEKTITGSTVTETHYVSSPTGLVAVLVKQGPAVQTYYVETDHLGSVTGIINTDKTYASRSSYDAWGRRRNPSDWSYNNIPAPVITDRGFTGHEHLDRFGLINMNGRMYDPVVGRFLGVDPIVQAPDYSQSYNGYSYCWNNPLKYTDPSGMRRCADDYEVNLSVYSHWMTDIRFPDLGYGDIDWLNSYLTYSRTCFENGYQGSVSDFDYALFTSSNSESVTVQTGVIDYFTFVSFDGGETWYQGNYINSKPIYSTIQIPQGGGTLANEDLVVLYANMLAMKELGLSTKDIKSYGPESSLYSKLSRLNNPQNYIKGWHKSFNSSSKKFDALISPVIGSTGFALKYYPTKNGYNDAIGLVKVNEIGHYVESSLEIEEAISVKFFNLQDDWLYDMHLNNSIQFIRTKL